MYFAYVYTCMWCAGCFSWTIHLETSGRNCPLRKAHCFELGIPGMSGYAYIRLNVRGSICL